MSNSDALTHQNEVNVLIRVRYSECDAQQVVFNARYADYADIAATEYMRVLIGNYQNLLREGFDNQVVSLHIDWLSSAKFDDVINLKVVVERVGTTSFSLLTTCERIDNDNVETIAKITAVYVVVDTKEYSKHPLPDVLKRNFQRAFNTTINQAG